MTKYELTDETKEVNGRTLHRIRAVRDVGSIVGKGWLGGWIGSEKNLSHDGECWVSDSAMVYDNALVCDNARVCEHAVVYGDAQVYGNARVSVNARVCGNAQVYESADVYGNAQVYGNADVSGNARVCEHAVVCGSAIIRACARVHGRAVVKEHAVIYSASVYGDATVCGFAIVDGRARICGDVVIEHSYDYAVFKNTWSSMRFFTYTRPDHMWCVGCFRGTGKELIKKAYEDDARKGRCYEATIRYMEQIEAIMA